MSHAGCCPNCGSHDVTPIGNTDDGECLPCGWLTSEGLGGSGFDWDGHHKSRGANA